MLFRAVMFTSDFTAKSIHKSTGKSAILTASEKTQAAKIIQDQFKKYQQERVAQQAKVSNSKMGYKTLVAGDAKLDWATPTDTQQAMDGQGPTCLAATGKAVITCYIHFQIYSYNMLTGALVAVRYQG